MGPPLCTCCYSPIGQETSNRIKTIKSWNSHTKSGRLVRPLIVRQDCRIWGLYKSANFKTTTKIYLTQLSMHYFIYCYTINSFKSSLSCFQLGKNRFNKAVYSSLCKRTLICNNSCTTMYSIHGSGFFINSRLKIIFRVR